MIKRLIFGTTFFVALSSAALAQNSNTSGSHAPRRAAPAKTTAAQPAAQEAAPAAQGEPAASRTRRAVPPGAAQSSTETLQAHAVREAFDSLVDGIRRADAAAVMKLYWNSPQLVVFNNNGTVTRTWEQAKSNRESLYARISDVKLDVRDVRVRMLGASAALVTCLWDQSQTADGQPEHATGRLTIVYQKVGADWKIVHTHTSPDKPSPSNLLPSERTAPADAGPAAKPPARP